MENNAGLPPRTPRPRRQDNKALSDRDREFLKLEYQALRVEIVGLKERVIREFAIGLTGIPVLFGSAYSVNYSILLLLGPIVVVSGYLMLLFEQNSIMRAGAYIGAFIEDKLLDHPDLGWEYWLEEYDGNRQAEAYFHYSALIAFCIYYLTGVWLAWDATIKLNFIWLSIPVVLLYGCCFLFALSFIQRNFRVRSEYKNAKRTARETKND